MFVLWIIGLLFATTDADHFGLLFTNTTGVFLKNISTGIIEPVIQSKYGASSVDFYGDEDVFAILNSNQTKSYRIVRVKFPNSTEKSMKCIIPDWCTHDENCRNFCNVSKFRNPTEVHISKYCENASNLVVDWKSSKLYWTCQDKPLWTINMADFDGGNHKVVTNLTSVNVFDLAIDPYERKIFWLQMKDSIMKLVSFYLNGKEEKDVMTPNSGNPLSTKMILDIHNNKIYLINTKDQSNLGECMEYDGSGVKKMDPVLLQNIRDMQIGIQSRLYHPNVQGRNINCEEYNCTDGCRLLTINGVKCLTDIGNKGLIQTTSSRSTTVTQDKNNHFDVSDDSPITSSVTNTEVPSREDSVTTPVTSNQTTAVYLTPNVAAIGDVFTTSTDKTADKNVVRDSSDGKGNTIASSTTSVASGSSRIAMFFVVATTFCFTIFFVIFITKRKVKKGKFRPVSLNKPLDTFN